MATTAPAAGDTVKVVDQSSEYRGKTGTATSVDESGQILMVKFSDSHKSVRLRLTQIKVVGTANGGSIATRNTGNNEYGSVHGAGDSRFVPKNDARRDYPGAGYNPHDATGTLGDTRPAQV